MDRHDYNELIGKYKERQEILTKNVMSLSIYSEMDYHTVANMTHDEREMLFELTKEKLAFQTNTKIPEKM